MMFYLLLCNVLFIPLIFCFNVTVSEPNALNKSLSDPRSDKLVNGTISPMLSLSEGGSILSGSETLVLGLPKENPAVTNLDGSQDKKKIVPRKGAPPNNSEEVESLPSLIKKPIDGSPTSDQTKTISDDLKNSSNKSVLIKQNALGDNISNTTSSVNKTKIIHKPLILNSDVLESITVKSSPESLGNQIQSPNKVSSYIASANNHPGMVMPIVITILLVPMFAVLGYMALRRGQEAWKNRHYKRMDFLLDGMYND